MDRTGIAINMRQGSHEIKDQLILMTQELRENNRMVAQVLSDRPSATPAPDGRSVAAMST